MAVVNINMYFPDTFESMLQIHFPSKLSGASLKDKALLLLTLHIVIAPNKVSSSSVSSIVHTQLAPVEPQVSFIAQLSSFGCFGIKEGGRRPTDCGWGDGWRRRWSGLGTYRDRAQVALTSFFDCWLVSWWHRALWWAEGSGRITGSPDWAGTFFFLIFP